MNRANGPSTARKLRNPSVCQLIALALVLTQSFPVLAGETAALAPTNVMEIKELDEIVVTGDLDSLSGAKLAVVEAEDRFYARYNELNKDDRYDISCNLETPKDHHSRISTRVCEAQFVSDGTHDEAVRLLTAPAESNVRLASTESMRMAGKAELRRRTLELLSKDPELLRALLERTRLQEHYVALGREKFKDGSIVWD